MSLGIVATLLFLIPLLFPDGRPPSPRWWPVVWVAILAGLVTSVSSAISDVNLTSNFPRLRDPVVVVAPLGAAYNWASSVELFVFVVAALSMIARFRRSGQEQRSQLKWFMYASAIAAVDRRFNRVRYDANQTVAAFAAMLRDAVDLETARAGLLAAVNTAAEPAHISVWIACSRPGPPTSPCP